MIEFSYSHLLFGMGILAVILISFVKQKYSLWYLLSFSVFWVYLLYVVSVIVFPIAPLAREYSEIFSPRINLTPFYFGTCDIPELCLRSIAGNILLTMPFGFGIRFIAHLKPKDFFWVAILVGLTLEVTQLTLSFIFRSAFRASDINDVILNAVGVWSGYFFFRVFGHLYLYLTQRFELRHRFVFAYIYDIIRHSATH